jgi:hypothetical protein
MTNSSVFRICSIWAVPLTEETPELNVVQLQSNKKCDQRSVSTKVLRHVTVNSYHNTLVIFRGQLKCDGTRAESRFRLSAKWTSPFKSAGGVSSVDYWQPRYAHQLLLLVIMLDTPCSEVMGRVLATHSIRQFPLHFPSRASPCDVTFQLESTSVQGVRDQKIRIFTNTAVKISYLAEILSLRSFHTCAYQEHALYTLQSGAYWRIIPSHEWYALLELQSFQTHFPRIDRLAPFVWIMLLVKGFRENVHIIALGLYWAACQRIETTWSLVDARNRNILVSSVKPANVEAGRADYWQIPTTGQVAWIYSYKLSAVYFIPTYV